VRAFRELHQKFEQDNDTALRERSINPDILDYPQAAGFARPDKQ
jgi:hypothetical protein